MRTALGEKAFAPSVFLIPMLPMAVVTALSDSARQSSAELTWFIVALGGTLVAAVVFALFGFITNRMHDGVARSVAVLAGFTLTGTLRALSIGLVSSALQGPAALALAFRVPSGAILGLTLFGLTSFLVNSASQYRTDRERLISNIAQLQEHTSGLERTIEQERRQILGEVSARIGAAVNALDVEKIGTSAAAAYKTLVAQLLEISQSVVRPLSKEIMEPVVAGLPDIPTPAESRVSFRGWIEAATRENPIVLALPLIGWGVQGLVTMLGLHAGIWGYAACATYLAVLAVVLLLARRLVVGILSRIALGARVVVLSATFLLAGWLPGLAAVLVLDRDAELGQSGLRGSFLVGDAIITFAFLWLLAVISGLQRARVHVVTQLAASGHALERSLSSLRSRLRLQRLEIARKLHGDVQGTILALALKLQNALVKGEATSQLVDEVRRLASQTVAITDFACDYPPCDVALDSLASTWSGVCHVDFSIDSKLRTILDESTFERGVFIAIVTDLVLNSIKHGHAKKISVRAHLREHMVYELIVEDDGSGLPDDHDSGLGWSLLADAAMTVEVVNAEPGVRVAAVIALEADVLGELEASAATLEG